MKLFVRGLIFLTLILSTLFSQTEEVDILLEKVTQTQTQKEKKELIEDLKQKLAKKNKQAREESEAIIKAKQKIPMKIYRPSSE